jgi:hypothetical protein
MLVSRDCFTVLLLGIPWKTEFYTEVNSILRNLELFNCVDFSGIPCFFIHGPYQQNQSIKRLKNNCNVNYPVIFFFSFC